MKKIFWVTLLVLLIPCKGLATESIVKDYIRIRHRLIPYIYSEMYKYSKDGINLIKPLYLDYEKILDEPLYKNEYH